jgi:hypothetical protein
MWRRGVLVGALILSGGAVATPARSADPPEIPLTIENHRFTPEEITVTAGTSFVLVITNKDATPEGVRFATAAIAIVAPSIIGEVSYKWTFKPEHAQEFDGGRRAWPVSRWFTPFVEFARPHRRRDHRTQVPRPRPEREALRAVDSRRGCQLPVTSARVRLSDAESAVHQKEF